MFLWFTQGIFHVSHLCWFSYFGHEAAGIPPPATEIPKGAEVHGRWGFLRKVFSALRYYEWVRGKTEKNRESLVGFSKSFSEPQG
jgi:hypothetical protein